MAGQGGSMLRQIRNLRGYKMLATDGEIGKARDFYFDDQQWIVRYFVVDLGNWITRHEVLIAPDAVSGPRDHELPVNLAREQIEHSPDIDTQSPVSRRHETALRRYYGWPLYWGGAAVIGTEPVAGPPERLGDEVEPEPEKTHLRSVNEVAGYSIHAHDGQFGHIDDFVIDDAGWAIRYLIIDTRDWLPAKHVLISPEWVSDVQWSSSTVSLNLARAKIENAPAFQAGQRITREYEHALHDYYGRSKYWEP